MLLRFPRTRVTSIGNFRLFHFNIYIFFKPEINSDEAAFKFRLRRPWFRESAATSKREFLASERPTAFGDADVRRRKTREEKLHFLLSFPITIDRLSEPYFFGLPSICLKFPAMLKNTRRIDTIKLFTGVIHPVS
jgi:hypothetical protein